mmetsp:Transcript_62852/g.184314  ORF Transcript_62852/g.184314 Transcript_62852/m.184314 type:complete len:216 (+) Transcript_62852:717-1364(+)
MYTQQRPPPDCGGAPHLRKAGRPSGRRMSAKDISCAAWPPSAAMPRRSPTRSAEGIAIDVRPLIHWQRWQLGHWAPFRQPPFRRRYLHGVAHVCGWPTVPSDVKLATISGAGATCACGFWLRKGAPSIGRERASSHWWMHPRRHWHKWHFLQFTPSWQPVFRLTYLQGAPQQSGWPVDPALTTKGAGGATSSSACSCQARVASVRVLGAPESCLS